MSQIKRSTILVPVDFTTQSQCAIEHAMRVAKTAVNEILLFHVLNSESKASLKKSNLTEKDLVKKLENLVSDISAHGISSRYIIREGSVFTEIGKEATDSHVGLVVFGTHGVKGVQHITGANSLKLVETCPVPVIIVQSKNPSASGFKKIFVPVDSEKEEKQKVFHVIAIAKLFMAEVTLFAQHDSDEFTSQDINNNITFIANQLDEENIKYTIVEQSPKGDNFLKQALANANSSGADLITIISQKGRDLSEFILGPINEKIINNEAMIPVLCVNPMETHKYTESVFSM